MNHELVVHNIKTLCKIRGIKHTTACEESGAGKSLVSDLNRGRAPSVEKFQMLAAYLGVTTSELLGEAYIKHMAGEIVDTPVVSDEAMALARAYDRADEPIRKIVRSALEPYIPPAAHKKAT